MPAVLLCLASGTLAADPPPPTSAAGSNNDGRAAMRRWDRPGGLARPQQMGERLIDQLLANTKLTEAIGLNADVAAKLRDELHALQAQCGELEAQINKISLEQEGHLKKWLWQRQPPDDSGEIMKTVEEIGRLRTEQAKLNIQNLLVIRKYLTPEQIGKARELLRDRGPAAAGKDGEARPGKRDSQMPPPAPPPKPSDSGN